MKRVSIVTLSLLLPLVAFAAPACSSEADPDPGGAAGTGTTTAGTGTTTAGTGTTTAGTGTGGTGSSTGGTTGTAGATTGGTVSGGTTGTGGTGTAGAGTAGAGTAGAGTAGAGTAGSGGSGGAGSCPAKIDSKVMCTAAITCNDAYCGVFKLGSKDCTCAGAVGFFECTSCDYAGKTEEIVVPPASPLALCTADDMTLEDTTGCTKGERCRSTDAAKVRFCACWDDPVAGGTVWDCDAMPSAWPK